MWNRSCPLCSVKVQRTTVLARSDELTCPSCHSALEVSRPSRVFAAFWGVIAAYLAVEIIALALPKAAWFLTVVAAVLAYGVVSALALYLISDLVVRHRPITTAFPHGHE